MKNPTPHSSGVIFWKRVMDTNDLTEKSYEILKLAEDIDHIVTVHIGAMCARFKNEDELLPNVIKFLQAIINDPKDFIESWDLEEEISVEKFASDLLNLKKYIESVIAIPVGERGLTIEESDFR